MADGLGVPILCAGDVFDRWNSPPELINWAIENLTPMYAVPGQHDMPHHDPEQLRRSAYWTLTEVGMLVNVCEPPRTFAGSMKVHGWGWGAEIGPPEPEDGCLNIALIHSYAYPRGGGHPGAREDQSLAGYRDRLKGYDVAVFGDNHQTFRADVGETRVVNCGCLIPRKQNERDHRPVVHILHDDCEIQMQYLDTLEDWWAEPVEEKEGIVRLDELDDFVEELQSLNRDSLDFRAAVERYLDDNETGKEARQAVLEAMG
jgi:hypothetical protein